LDRPFFKIWAAEALLSDDLDALTDHERSIWLFLLCTASLESPRWHARVTPNLARKCKTTEPKLRSALAKMSDLGMVVFDGTAIHMHTAERWNEETYSKPPSASPERVRERVAKHRNDRRNEGSNEGSNDPVTTPGNDVKRADVTGNKREEIREKSKEEDQEVGAKAPRLLRKPLSDEHRDRLREDFAALPKLDERIEEALAHRAALKATDEYLYLRTWLRKDLERMPTNGRNATPVSSAAEQAERARLRTLGVI